MWYENLYIRFADVALPDWVKGYDNVIIGCTVENQAAADYRRKIFIDIMEELNRERIAVSDSRKTDEKNCKHN